jgi:phosphoesterase RecJ-like protein
VKVSLPFEAVARVLRASRTAFLTVHQRPDGDALGSQLALARVCRHLGIKVWMANEDRVPERYAFLPGARAIHTGPAGAPKRFDVAFVLECATLKRAGNCGPLARRARVVINMDHHLNNAGYGTYNLVDPTAPATVLLAESLREIIGVRLSREIAVDLYVGLYTETGGFRYNNTTPEVLRLASELVAAGVNPKWVGELVYERQPLRRMKLLALALDSLTVRDGVSWMTVTREDFDSVRGTEEDVEDFVEYPRMVRNVKIAVFLRETAKGNIRVSLRAKADVPVNRIAERFGGGGHAYAAGCTVWGAGPEAARRRLAAAIRLEMRRRRGRKAAA